MVAKVSVAIGVFVACVVAFTWPTRHAVYFREDLMLALAPSAAQAYEYGNAHFNALTEDEYDIHRARELYRVAIANDPDYPGLQHQMARIDFLYGNYDTALKRINREIRTHGEDNPNAWYVKALILGFQGRYLDAATTYEKYFTLTAANWGSINDYSWVLLKAGLPEGALAALEWGLAEWPDNPWLLHNKAIALFEVGRYEDAAQASVAAAAAVAGVTERDWLTAYPGNDPRSAGEGLRTFREAVTANQQKITDRLAKKPSAN